MSTLALTLTLLLFEPLSVLFELFEPGSTLVLTLTLAPFEPLPLLFEPLDPASTLALTLTPVPLLPLLLLSVLPALTVPTLTFAPTPGLSVVEPASTLTAASTSPLALLPYSVACTVRAWLLGCSTFAAPTPSRVHVHQTGAELTSLVAPGETVTLVLASTGWLPSAGLPPVTTEMETAVPPDRRSR